MKRATLVSYSSSEADEDEDEEKRPALKKRRKLPALSSSLVVAGRVDDPSLHQGRVRATPHVEGQWASHIYLSVSVDRRGGLFKTIERALDSARTAVPSLHDFFGNTIDKLELHISLSRPIFLRSHQHDDLKRAVRAVAGETSAFTASFASFSELTNDERTRTFLALEIGAGHHELASMCKTLSPALQHLRQKIYYDQPRFHASIAWALLDHPGSQAATIPHFPADLVPQINMQYQEELSKNIVRVEDIAVKIGKDVFKWQLAV